MGSTRVFHEAERVRGQAGQGPLWDLLGKARQCKAGKAVFGWVSLNRWSGLWRVGVSQVIWYWSWDEWGRLDCGPGWLSVWAVLRKGQLSGELLAVSKKQPGPWGAGPPGSARSQMAKPQKVQKQKGINTEAPAKEQVWGLRWGGERVRGWLLLGATSQAVTLSEKR